MFIIYINDIVLASTFFEFIIYADDTSLFSTLSIFNSFQSIEETSQHVNDELTKISTWLKVNKLSLNIKKTFFMIFHHQQKHITVPNLEIDNVKIKCVDEFNFLGITLDQHMTWNNHIQKIASKVSQTIGIMNKLKNFLPPHILQIIYNSLILPKFNYGLLLWGHKFERLEKVQKKAVRLINHSKYNAHTNPIFKSRKLLKIQDIYTLQILKFYYKIKNELVPSYFSQQFITPTSQVHDHNTRHKTLFIPLIRHSFAKKRLRLEIVRVLNSVPELIKEKVHTHSYQGFSNYVKLTLLNDYEISCTILNCYICNSN